jgi:hypothetical protein
METNSSQNKNDQKYLLEHARILMLQASELRMKNFNFYLIITGAMLAISGKNDDKNYIIPLMCIAGFILSILFLILDIRGKQILSASFKELSNIERELGIQIQANIKSPKFNIISHTCVYRLIYGLVIGVSVFFFFFKI